MAKQRTHCSQGHLLTEDNVIVEVRGNRKVRRCRTCRCGVGWYTPASPHEHEEDVQCLGSRAMDALNNVSIEELPAHAALEQVRAMYALTINVARISDLLERITKSLESIDSSLPMAGRGI